MASIGNSLHSFLRTYLEESVETFMQEEATATARERRNGSATSSNAQD